MGFPESVLTTDETVSHQLHPHWKALISPVFWLLAAAVAAVATWLWLGDSKSAAASVTVPVVCGIAVLAFAVLSFWPWLRWRTTHYVLTSERVIVRSGVISRNGRDIPLSRINDVSFSHGIVGRMLGCGTLTIESAGERGQIVLNDVPGVERIQSVIYELVEADRDRHSFDDSDRDALRRDQRGPQR